MTKSFRCWPGFDLWDGLDKQVEFKVPPHNIQDLKIVAQVPETTAHLQRSYEVHASISRAVFVCEMK